MAMKPDDAERTLCKKAIAEHLEQHGPTNWTLVRDKFPHIKERTFFLWVKQVREGEMPDDQAIRAAKEAAKLSRMLPAAVPPEYVARKGPDAARDLDLLGCLGELWSDAQIYREYASKVTVDAETGEVKREIKIPAFFDNSIKRRLELIMGAVAIMREVWDLDFMRDFYNELSKIIVDELEPYPDVQRRVLERLQLLSAERMATMSAIELRAKRAGS